MRTVEILQIAGALLGAFATIATGFEQRIVRKLKNAGATQPETAIELAPGNPVSRWRLSRLRDAGAVVAAPSGDVFLDLSAYRALRARRRRRALTMVGVLLAVILATVLFR
jgi:hypothetical protein